MYEYFSSWKCVSVYKRVYCYLFRSSTCLKLKSFFFSFVRNWGFLVTFRDKRAYFGIKLSEDPLIIPWEIHFLALRRYINFRTGMQLICCTRLLGVRFKMESNITFSFRTNLLADSIRHKYIIVLITHMHRFINSFLRFGSHIKMIDRVFFLLYSFQNNRDL